MPTFSGLKSKGDLAFHQDDLLQAISYYTDALAIDEANQEVLGCRSAVYSKLGMHNEAKKDAERLIIATPSNPKGYFIKAVSLENLGNYTDSLKAFLSAYERDSQHPLEIVLYVLQVSGRICQLEDDEEFNLSAEGISEDVNKFQALVQIGKRFCKNKDYKLSITVLKTAVTAHCSLSRASFWLSGAQDLELSSGIHADAMETITMDTTSKHAFSSVYLTTGDTAVHGNLDESQVRADKTPAVDSQSLMSALITLCKSHFSLGQFRDALVFSKKCLQLALECGNKKYELKSYVHLANIYQKQGDYLQAISYNSKLLAVGRDIVKSNDYHDYEKFWNSSEECKALWNLCAAYKSLRDIKTARSYGYQYLEVIQSTGEGNLSVAHSNLGELELLMENLEAALEQHKMELKFAKKVHDKIAISYAYGNIGNVYAAMGNKTLSEINHQQHRKLAQSMGDELSELAAMKQFGDMYRLLGDYNAALEHYNDYLVQVKQKRQDTLQCQALSVIGLCYWKLNQLYRAQHNFELSLKLATELSEKEEELNSRISLAKIMKALRQYEKCRQYYNQVIPSLEHRLYVKQGIEIIYDDETSDNLTDCYEDLIEALVEMDLIKEALEISEHCNSRTLVNILRRKEVLKDSEQTRILSDFSPSTSEEICKLVDSSNSIVIVYSRLKDGFASWLLSPGNQILKFHRYKNCDHVTIEERIKLCIEDLHRNHVCDYKCDQRSLPCDHVKSVENSHVVQPTSQSECKSKSCFTCTFYKANVTPLQRLYEVLLEPFRDQLKDNITKTLTIIPGDMLTMVPFPSLQDTTGSCLYQHFNVSIMPCIRSLSLAKQTQLTEDEQEEDKDVEILVAGNPNIPNVNLDGSNWCPSGKADLAEQEVTSLAALLGVEPITGSLATTEHIIEILGKSSLVHLVTYGDWKKGLAFTPNRNCFGDPPSEHAYLITAADLLAVDLRAKLIVISSCVSCSHTFSYLKQVNLSLATAMLAVGARTVICPLWSVEQVPLIKFYSYLYVTLEKGETVSNSLKEARNQIKSISEFADPVYWSSHIMLGFDTTIDLPRLRYKLFADLVDREVTSVEPKRFTVKELNPQDVKVMSDNLRSFLTSLMFQHGSFPDVLPALRDVIKLSNSMLTAYEEGQQLDQIVMSTNLSSKILDAPFSRSLLLFLGFNFQCDGAKNKDPFIVFPHWDYNNLLDTSAIIFDAVCSIFDISAVGGHQLARLLKDISHRNMERLKDLLAITSKYPTRIVKTSDFMIRSLWCNHDAQRFLLTIGFYVVGQSLLFNKNEANQSMIKGTYHVISSFLGRIKTGTSKIQLQVRELSSESCVKLDSLSPLITASKQVVMGTPWMSKRAPPNEAKRKLQFARELEAINKDFNGIVTRSNFWHAQLLRAQTSKSPSLPIISQSHPKTDNKKQRVKVKVVSGLTPSCTRPLVEDEPKMTELETRERRNTIYKIYGQRYDNITMRKRNEIRELFVTLAEQSK